MLFYEIHEPFFYNVHKENMFTIEIEDGREASLKPSILLRDFKRQCKDGNAHFHYRTLETLCRRFLRFKLLNSDFVMYV